MSRERLLQAFLEAAGWGGAERRVLAADASFRRYDRLWRGEETAVLMDAPPPQEDVRPFLRIARGLTALGFSAPRVLAADEAAGFLLLEDLGDRTFTRALAEGAAEAPLYDLAVDCLVALQRAWTPESGPGAPPYDEEALLREARLLTEWFWPAVAGRPLPAESGSAYDAAWREVFAHLGAAPQTLVLRDYHVDNLLILPAREGTAACGLLDFQDALIGEPAYDLVSLLKDVRRDVSPEVEAEGIARFLAGRPELDVEAFKAAYAILGVQRNAKIVGIFTRLDRRDAKPGYLRHIPRTWRLIEDQIGAPVLAPVKEWFEKHIPKELRSAPEASS